MTAKNQEIDPLISKFLFDYIRLSVDKDDFDLFKNTINHASLMSVNNPRFIQNEIHTSLYKEIHPPLFLYNRSAYEKILREISCFEFLLKYWTCKDFSSVSVIANAYRLYEMNLEKYIFSITKSEELIKEIAKMYGTDRDGVLKMVETTINSINVVDESDYFCIPKQFELLYISLNLHFTFYRIGAFIIFAGKQKRVNSARYIKELWDHTRPDDASGINLNETPALFDPLWLTYLHFYGGKNVESWTRATFSFHLGFDDYHGPEKYLYQYYLLMITRCVESAGSSLSLPSVEELDNLRAKEPYKFKEFFEFANLFIRESTILLSHCDDLIQNSHQWDLLFNDHARESFEKTKEWIQNNVANCENISLQLKTRMVPDNERIGYFSQKVLEEYRNTSIVDKLAEVRKFNEVTDSDLQFIPIGQQIGNLDKRWFFKEDDSHPDHIFAEFGREISRRERVHILATIKKASSIEILTLKEIHTSAIFGKITDIVSQMKNGGLNPSVIFLPLELTTQLTKEHLGNFATLKINDDTSLIIVNSNNRWEFKEIVILDRSAGAWIYKPNNSTEERLSVEITPNANDELLMKILVKTTVNYSIVKPDAAKILKFDLNVVPPV